MKKYFLTIFVVLTALFVMAEGKKVWIYSHYGNHIGVDISEFDSLSFVEPGFIELNPTEKHISSEGGRFSLGITANKSWTATVNDPAIILGATQGTGDANISVIALPNTDNQPYSGIITVTLVDGTYKQAIVTVAPNNASYTTETSVTDCQGNTYPVVKIGNQYWMAENLRCTKYDTESERAGVVLTKTTWILEEDLVPSYKNAMDKSTWEKDGHHGYVDRSYNLSEAQINKLGYLYNWAAATGLSSESEAASTSVFIGNRQGICPNGWHIPTVDEWDELIRYIEVTDGKGDETAGKHLKASSGWWNDECHNVECLNTYGFAVLPAGQSSDVVDGVGSFTIFMTASNVREDDCYTYFFSSCEDNAYREYENGFGYKGYGRSVRCVRN